MKYIDAIGWYKKIHFREVVCLFFIEKILWGVTISLHFVDLEVKISSASNMEEWHYF